MSSLNQNPFNHFYVRSVIYSLVIFCVTACQSTQQQLDDTLESEIIHQPIALVLHGGAGTILKENMTPELEQQYIHVLDSALTVGYQILENGGESIDAVTAVIVVLENSPLFNAGKGAVLTHDETNELDASIMDGATLNAGAVAGVKTVKNPILLAKEIMLHSSHVMMAREGAELFAQEQGLELVDPSYFFVQNRLDALNRIKEKEIQEQTAATNDSKFGTVGCVALDKHGNIVAGTSTGGMTNKRWGRIGDSPIIGAGTYANNATCGVSATGWGEFFIRGVVAYDIAALIEYKGLTLKEAARIVIQEKLPKLGGDGGIIALDKMGKVTMEFNTSGMFRAAIDGDGAKFVGMFEKD